MSAPVHRRLPATPCGPPAPIRTAGHLAALDGARGVAALSVLLLHAWLYTTRESTDLSSPLDAIMHELRLGLVLFFVLSGFLLWRPWLSENRASGPFGARVRRYAARRAARILPAYYAALAGAVAIVALSADIHHAVSPARLPLFLVFAQNMSADTLGRLDPPMWTLGVEVSFYIAVPVLALAARRLRRTATRALLVPLGLILAGTAYNLLIAGDHVPAPTLVNQLPAMAPDFACGMLAAALLGRGPLPANRRAVLLLAGALLVIGDGAWHTQFNLREELIVRDLPAAAGFACLLVGIVRAPRTRLLGTRPLRALGSVSYGLYLWHMPVIFGLRAAGWWPDSLVPAALLLSGTTMVVATASWRWVEQPVLRAVARRVPPTRVPAPVRAHSRPPRPRALAPVYTRGG